MSELQTNPILVVGRTGQLATALAELSGGRAMVSLGRAELDFDKPPAAWEQIEKFDLDVPFWKMVKTTFGYDEETPSPKNFLLGLLLPDYANYLQGSDEAQ